MQVYVELALLENFCMDFTLLYCAKLVCRNRAKVLRLILVSLLGACFAVVFPLFKLQGIFAIAVKLISGAIICLISCKFKSFKAYFKLTAVFFAFTFVLGGALIAVFSLAGVDYSLSEGYVLSSVPVGIPMFGVLILIIVARKLANKLRKCEKAEVTVRIFSGEKSVQLKGFFDSGNKVYYFGQPVSIISLESAQKIIDTERIKEQVKIHTVAGSKKIKIFSADKIEILSGEKTDVIKDVKIGISLAPSSGAVLHPDLLED